MLKVLCGSHNVEKILLFLFVNGKCYATQLHRLLQTPLTPLQKTLLRLEQGGLITSYYEGKTRVYQFHPSFPLLPELEQLLKKAYTLLSSYEKRSYYRAQEEKQLTPKVQSQLLLKFWKQLGEVKQLSFEAKTPSKEESGWNGRGRGEVIVKKEGEQVLIFMEKGSWRDKKGEEVIFSNIFRWSFEKNTGQISLEHLRYGVDHPVFLFYLVPINSHALSSVDSHLCGGDTYFGHLEFGDPILKLSWRVIGIKKNEEIDYYYS